MEVTMSHVVIIMAAGDGVRMRSDTPKVLHPLAGRPILSWIVDAAAASGPERMMVVVGSGARRVRSLLPPWVETCFQSERRGTGHAVSVAMDALGEVPDRSSVVVLPGDVPLLPADVISAAVESHRSGGGAATMLTAVAEDPSGYGRVLRDAGGRVRGVVEHVDATEAEREVQEINTSIYVFAAGPLRDGLGRIGVGNVQGEYYLPDVIGVMVNDGREVSARLIPFGDSLGVNDQAQLAKASARMRRRILNRHMLAGVRMEDPDRTYVEESVRLAPGVRLYPGVHLEGDVEVEEGAVLGTRRPHPRQPDRGRGPGVVFGCSGSRDRPGRRGRSLRIAPTGHPDRGGRQGRDIRGDQERQVGEGRQSPASLLSGRRRCGGGGQCRSGDHHRQLRRLPKAPHHHRAGGADRFQHGPSGAG